MWPEERSLQLIALYRDRRLLWDTKHINYYNKNLKNKAWDEIAAELDTTDEECRRKMYGLQSSMRREKYKIKKSQKAGRENDDMYRSCWFAFKSMSFLLEKKDKPRTITSTSQTNKSGRSDDINAGNVPTTTSAAPHHYADNKRKSNVEGPLHNVAGKSDDDDISQLFGSLVAKKMRMYTPLVQSAVQQAVMNVFFNADRGYYDQAPSSSMFDPSLSHQNFQYQQSDTITESTSQQIDFQNTLTNLKYDSVTTSENDDQ